MSEKFVFWDEEYDTNKLSDVGKSNLQLLKFTNERVQELDNQVRLLRRAKGSYVSSLKQEILSNKAGFSVEDN